MAYYNRKYGRSYSKARRRYGKSLSYRSKYSKGNRRTGGLNRLVTNRKRRIGRGLVMIKPELKSFDYDFLDILPVGPPAPAYPIDLLSTGRTWPINSKIQTGSGVNQVVGTHITVKLIEIRVEFYLGNNDDDTLANLKDNDWICCSLVLDTQANGAQAAITDIFNGAEPTQFKNVANEQRFKIIGEKQINLVCPTLTNAVTNYTTTRDGVRMLNWKIPCNIRIDVQNPGGAIARIRSNNLLFIVRAQQNQYTNILSGKARIRYTDV